MVTNNTLDSKEEDREIPKRKNMEHEVDSKPEESSSLSSKMPDTPASEGDLSQTFLSWVMVSVAVGLITIYTIVQLISNKLAKEIKGKETNEEKITNYSSQEECKETKESLRDFLAVESTKDDDEDNNSFENIDTSLGCNFEQNIKHSMHVSCKIKDTVKRVDLDRLIQGDVECLRNGSNVISVQMGPPFHGNLSITSEASVECNETHTKINLNDENSDTITYEANCCNVATLQNDNPTQTTHVQVNYLQPKCITCNTEIPEGNNIQLLSDSTMSGPQLENVVIPTKLQDDLPTPENNYCPEHQPVSTVNCIQTSKVKTLSCDLPVTNEPPKPELLQKLTKLECKGDSKMVSDTSNYLTKDKTDGQLLSKNCCENMASRNRAKSCPKEIARLETQRSRFQRSIREDPVLSKSLDSQIEALKKGCQLLEKKPSKSCLMCSGSEGCLTKKEKFVHFPEDIRNIRTVHKYQSFEESWNDLDVEDTTQNDQNVVDL